MRYPLNKWQQKYYKHGERTFYGTTHRGNDYVAKYVNLYAPVSGKAAKYQDDGGGNWIFLYDSTGRIWQFAHLSKYIKLGYVNEGTKIAVTGNSGKWTTGPHLHLQIRKNGKYYDPEPILRKGVETVWKEKYERLVKKYNDVVKQNKINYAERIAITRLWRKAKTSLEASERLVSDLKSKVVSCTTKLQKAQEKPSDDEIVKNWFKRLFKIK